MSIDVRALCLAVIHQALTDATLPLTPSEAKRLSARMNQKRAREWFLKPNRDFDDICERADLEPDYVRRRAIPRIEEAIRQDHPSILQPAPRRKPAPRQTRSITFNGETLSIADWSKRIGITYFALNKRLLAGWPVERVLTPKLYTRGPKPKPAQELQAESIAQ